MEPGSKINYADYDIIGFSININNISHSLKTAAVVKSASPKTDIVFGGPFASAYPEETIKNSSVDAVVVGEGEETFFEYVSGVAKGSIKGIYYRDGDTVRFTGKRSWIKNLDALPFPALSRINFKKSNMFFSRELPVSNIITSRGCPFQCAFCFHNMGHEWRGRSAENVVDEIEWQVKTLGVKELLIIDDNATFDYARAEKIFDGIVSRNIKVSIQCCNGLRADSLDENLIRKAKAAGVWIISLAPETGNPQTLEKLNKKFRLEDVQRALTIAKRAGLATETFFLIGLPWETQEDLEKTLSFAFELDPDFITLSRFVSFPGLSLAGAGKPFDLASSNDSSYSGISADNDKTMRKIVASFYWKFYLRPLKIYRTLKLLRWYSLNKLRRPYIFKNILLNLWEKLMNCFSNR
jgi:radical SAM superfamily enzyme YgiQ (UPF0313 family)